MKEPSIQTDLCRRVNYTCPEGYVLEVPGVYDEQTIQVKKGNQDDGCRSFVE